MALVYAFWIVRGRPFSYFNIVMLVFFAMASEGKSYAKICRCVLITGGIVLAALFFLSMTGIIDNISGNSFGIIYRTDYAAYLLSYILTLCLYRNGKLKHAEWIFVLIIFLFNALLIKGKTAGVCLTILIIATLLRNLKIVKKAARSPILVFSFWICAGIMILLSLIYRLFPDQLGLFLSQGKLATLWQRLILDHIAFDRYSVHLFGNDIPLQGGGGTPAFHYFYYFIDSSYVKMLMEYGLAVFLIIMLLMTWIQFRLRRMHRYYAIFLLSLVALDCIMEHHLTEFHYNTFALMAFSVIENNMPADAPIRRPAHPVRWFLYAVGTAGLVIFLLPCLTGSFNVKILAGLLLSICILLAAALYSRITMHLNRTWKIILTAVMLFLAVPAFITSYRISTAGSAEPRFNATLVIPGSQMEGVSADAMLQARLQAGSTFLKWHKTIPCIVSGPEAGEMKQQLTDLGIEESRIFTESEAENAETTIENAYVLTGEQELPFRMVMMVQDTECARVSALSEQLDIYVCPAAADTPPVLYPASFLTEQVNLARQELLMFFTHNNP